MIVLLRFRDLACECLTLLRLPAALLLGAIAGAVRWFPRTQGEAP